MLTAPTFKDEASTLSAGVLHVATMFIGLSSLLSIVVVAANGVATRSGTTIGGAAIVASIAMNATMRWGHVRAASIAFVVLCFTLTVAIAAHYGGIHPATFGLFVLVALLAGTLFSGRAAVIVCACALVVNGVLLVLESKGMLHQRGVLTPSSKLFSTSLVLVASTAIFVAALRRLRVAAETAEARRRELAAANESLQSIRASLQDTVAERTKSLVEARDAAEAATRAKTAFLANMSHELRTPLHAVIGITSLLMERKVDSEEQKLVETLRRGGDALLSVINDVLDLSKIEAGRMVVESAPYAPRTVVDECLALLGPEAVKKGLLVAANVATDVPEHVRGDKVRVRQVLLNIVGNAIKFTAAGSIQVDVRRDDAQRLRFSVRDTGAGVPPELRAHLFQPFVQGDLSTTKKHGGTGLGLSISKHLVELMTGEIGVDEAPGGGSSFWFSIDAPGAAEPPRPAEPLAGRARTARPPRALSILLAEDNVVSQTVATLLLQHLGHRAEIVETGVAVLEALARRPYDVVLMDVGMPEMDGLEATRRIRAERSDATKPWIIAVTANALPSEREACFAAGVNDFVTKPVLVEVLAAALAQVPAGAIEAA